MLETWIWAGSYMLVCLIWLICRNKAGCVIWLFSYAAYLLFVGLIVRREEHENKRKDSN